MILKIITLIIIIAVIALSIYTIIKMNKKSKKESYNKMSQPSQQCHDLLSGKSCSELEDKTGSNYMDYMNCYIETLNKDKDYFGNYSNCYSQCIQGSESMLPCMQMCADGCKKVFPN